MNNKIKFTIFFSILFLSAFIACKITDCYAQNNDAKNALDKATSKINTLENIMTEADLPNKESKKTTDKNEEIATKDEEEIIGEDEEKANKNDTADQPLKKDDKILNQEIPIPSLMFTIQEIKGINKALNASKNEQPFIIQSEIDIAEKTQAEIDYENRAISHIHLGSIIYISENNWLIWMNDNKISSRNNKPRNEFYIKSINKNQIDIVWTMSLSKWQILSNREFDNSYNNIIKLNKNNQVAISFMLQPNQTYSLHNNEILEGKIHLHRTESAD